MPLDVSQAMVNEILQRSKPAEVRQVETRPLSPDMVSLMGALADGASTTYEIAHNKATEANKAFGFTKNNPLATGAMAAGTGVGMMMIAKLLRKSHPKLAEMLQGPLASRQLAVGLTNFTKDPRGSDRAVSDALNTHTRGY
jgi:hypothetical protein